jgi:hypothetical protein
MHNWKEQDLFNWLKENIYKDLVKSKNQMSRWDCYSPQFKHRIELKCRTKHFDSMLLEKKKFDAMLSECEKHLDIPIYVNSTPRGIYFLNLLQIEPDWETNFRNPATTQFSNTNRVSKEVTYLRIESQNIIKQI